MSGDSSKFLAVRPTTRPPTIEDAAAVVELVRSSGVLEPNTAYAYVLLCSHFSSTSAVAELDGRVVGCCLGYRIPQQPKSIFLWQIGVDSTCRRMGIAGLLLDGLCARPELRDVESFELSIAPSNTASFKLFETWASKRGLSLERVGCFQSAVFGCATQNA